jgi:hypothetical protein
VLLKMAASVIETKRTAADLKTESRWDMARRTRQEQKGGDRRRSSEGGMKGN